MSEEWLVDSVVTQHMAYSKECVKNYQNIPSVDVHLAKFCVVQAVDKVDVIMSMRIRHGVKKGVLTGVRHILKFTRNLFSVGHFTKEVRLFTTESDECFVQAKSVKWHLGTRTGKELFKIFMTSLMTDEASVSISTSCNGITSSYLCHL